MNYVNLYYTCDYVTRSRTLKSISPLSHDDGNGGRKKDTATQRARDTVYRSSVVERPGRLVQLIPRLVFPAAVENEIVSEAVSSLSLLSLLLPTHG